MIARLPLGRFGPILLMCVCTGIAPARGDAPPALGAQPSRMAPPIQALGEHTVGVLLIDLVHADATATRAAVIAIFGQHAALFDESLGALLAKRDKLVLAGATDAALMIPEPGAFDEGGVLPLAVLPMAALGANADEAAIKKVLTEEMGQLAGGVTFARQGPWLLVQSKDRGAPVGPELQKHFEEALAAAGDRPVRLVIADNGGLKSSLTLQAPPHVPPAVAALLATAFGGRWIAVSAQLGPQPVIELTARMNSESAANDLLTQTETARQQLQALVRIFQSQGDTRSYGGGAKGPADVALFAALLEGFKPQQKGSDMTATLDDKALKALGDVIGPSLARTLAVSSSAASEANMRVLLQGIITYANGKTAYVRTAKGDVLDEAADAKLEEERRRQEQPAIFPVDIKDVADRVGGKKALMQLLINPRSGESPGYIYVRPAEKYSQVQKPGETPMLYESLHGKVDPNGLVGYADGHVAPGKK